MTLKIISKKSLNLTFLSFLLCGCSKEYDDLYPKVHTVPNRTDEIAPKEISETELSLNNESQSQKQADNRALRRLYGLSTDSVETKKD